MYEIKVNKPLLTWQYRWIMDIIQNQTSPFITLVKMHVLWAHKESEELVAKKKTPSVLRWGHIWKTILQDSEIVNIGKRSIQAIPCFLLILTIMVILKPKKKYSDNSKPFHKLFRNQVLRVRLKWYKSKRRQLYKLCQSYGTTVHNMFQIGDVWHISRFRYDTTFSHFEILNKNEVQLGRCWYPPLSDFFVCV